MEPGNPTPFLILSSSGKFLPEPAVDLNAYLKRINYDSVPNADTESLINLHHAHVNSVPFENLDVQLGIPLTTGVNDAYRKIVERGRGGWCYEQNGLFGWALSSLGFDVTRIAAGVMREERGETATANHLCLLVKVPDSSETYLADVGFGGSLMEPIALTEKEHQHMPFSLSLKKLDDQYWRFFETLGDQCTTFDFTTLPAREEQLASRSTYLQTNLSSSFVQNLVVQFRQGESHRVLRGRVLTDFGPGHKQSRRLLKNANELREVLANEFQLDVPEIVTLWPEIVARHKELFGAGSL